MSTNINLKIYLLSKNLLFYHFLSYLVTTINFMLYSDFSQVCFGQNAKIFYTFLLIGTKAENQ